MHTLRLHHLKVKEWVTAVEWICHVAYKSPNREKAFLVLHISLASSTPSMMRLWPWLVQWKSSVQPSRKNYIECSNKQKKFSKEQNCLNWKSEVRRLSYPTWRLWILADVRRHRVGRRCGNSFLHGPKSRARRSRSDTHKACRPIVHWAIDLLEIHNACAHGNWNHHPWKSLYHKTTRMPSELFIWLAPMASLWWIFWTAIMYILHAHVSVLNRLNVTHKLKMGITPERQCGHSFKRWGKESTFTDRTWNATLDFSSK